MTTQYADARFERTQPAELKRVPFAAEELQVVPSAVEAIGWAVLAIATAVLFVGFLGL